MAHFKRKSVFIYTLVWKNENMITDLNPEQKEKRIKKRKNKFSNQCWNILYPFFNSPTLSYHYECLKKSNISESKSCHEKCTYGNKNSMLCCSINHLFICVFHCLCRNLINGGGRLLSSKTSGPNTVHQKWKTNILSRACGQNIVISKTNLFWELSYTC